MRVPKFTTFTAGIAMLLGILPVLAVACSNASGSSPVVFGPRISGLPPYYTTVKRFPPIPGRLLKYQRLATRVFGATVYRVTYVSKTELGAPSYVTGLVYVPASSPPPGGYRVVSWAHGTNGMAPICAPSLTPQSAVPSLKNLLYQGYVVTASDYQGEGTPGLLPYIAGKVAAQNVIDIVRAAHQLPHLDLSSEYVVWGHSEGGQTALFAWEIGPSYAPELHLMGVVAGAPPSQLQYIYQFLLNSPFRFYLLMAALGLNEAYGNRLAPLNQVLTPKALQIARSFGHQCALDDFKAVLGVPTTELVKQDPNSIPTWHKLSMANDPAQFTTASKVPLLIIHGSQDMQIPAVTSALLAKHLCAIGAEVQRWLYPGLGHAEVIPPSTNDMIHWIADRFAGRPLSYETFTPVGPPRPSPQDCQTSFQ